VEFRVAHLSSHDECTVARCLFSKVRKPSTVGGVALEMKKEVEEGVLDVWSDRRCLGWLGGSTFP
jgi:hypothetical protein